MVHKRPAQTQRQCFRWGGLDNHWYWSWWNVAGIYHQWEKTPLTAVKHNRGPQCKCHLTAREEAQTSKLSILIIYQSGTCGGLKQNHSLKDQPRQLILNPQTSGRRGYLESRPLMSLLSFWELSHFQLRICGASIFHTNDKANPKPTTPKPALLLSFSSSVVPGSEI